MFGILKDLRMTVRVPLVWKQSPQTWRLGVQYVDFGEHSHVCCLSTAADFATFCVSHTSSRLSLVVNRLP